VTEEMARLIDRYRRGAIGMDDISHRRKARKCHAEMHACYKILRETEEGREAIVGLLHDGDPSVRCSAAAHSLQWEPRLAGQVLEALRDSQQGILSFEAEMVLREHEQGRLSFDY